MQNGWLFSKEKCFVLLDYESDCICEFLLVFFPFITGMVAWVSDMKHLAYIYIYINTGLLNTSDCGDVSAPILLDLSAVFDAVNRKILPNRLRLTEIFGMQDFKKIKKSWL